MRKSEIVRKTKETDITLSLGLDGNGNYSVDTGCGFLNHMLELFAVHGNFDLCVKCVGDTQVDYHHSVEDIGICLGLAFAKALGDKRGINRYGSIILPMDEALVLCAADFSGRSYLNFDLNITCPRIGDFDTELVREFFEAFARNAGITLHIKQFYGTNLHHIIECTFKAFARTLRTAVAVDASHPDTIPSSKGVI